MHGRAGFVVAAAAAFFMLALPGLARPQPLQWWLTLSGRHMPVEQQTESGASQPDPALWVMNPTPCLWDADDASYFSGAGYLDAGASSSVSECVVADWTAHMTGVRITARSPELLVTVTFQPQDRVFPLTARPSGHGYEYSACVRGPDYDHGSSLLPPVEGSNGGVGIVTTVTVTVTNPTDRRVRDVLGQFQLNWAPVPNGFCPGSVISDGIDPLWKWSV